MYIDLFREVFYFLTEFFHIMPYHRGMIAYLESKRNDDDVLVGVEIGSRDGTNARQILSRLNMGMLYLIDPYMPYQDGDTYRDQSYQDAVKARCLRRLRRFPSYSYCLIERTSSDAIRTFIVKDIFDFVYIDGDHSFGQVLEDIRLYYPCVCDGGVVGGHDWNIPEVMAAVCRFCADNCIPYADVHIGGEDWYIIKKVKQ